MKMLGRQKLDKPIVLGVGDKFVMTYVEIDGVVRTERTTALAVVVPHRAITVDQAVMFETEIDGRYAVGTMVLEAKRKD
jgi:hypothetical protein